MHRFFHPELTETSAAFRLGPHAVRHARARRLSPGERIQVFNGDGLIADAEVQSPQYDCVLQGPVRTQQRNTPMLRAILCVPKNDALDTTLSMLCEIGVDAIALGYSERSIAHWDARKSHTRMERLRRLAIEACEVSGKARLPLLTPPEPLLRCAESTPASHARLVFWEESEMPLRDLWRRENEPPAEHVSYVVGPEGGLSKREVEALEQMGFSHVSLGPWVMRVPTAALAATASLQALAAITSAATRSK